MACYITPCIVIFKRRLASMLHLVLHDKSYIILQGHRLTIAVAQHRLRPNKINQTQNWHHVGNKFPFLRFLYSLCHPYHHQSSLLCFLSSLLQCTIPHTDSHMGMIPFPVTMLYAYFRFYLILHGTFEGSSEVRFCLLIQFLVLMFVHSTHLCQDHFYCLEQ